VRLYLVRATEISSNTMRYDNKSEVMLEVAQNCYSSLDIIQLMKKISKKSISYSIQSHHNSFRTFTY